MPVHSQDYEKVCVIGLRGEFMTDDSALAMAAVSCFHRSMTVEAEKRPKLSCSR